MQSHLPEKFGKFKVVREIGKGGFGVVYEGRDPVLKRPVAIKTCTSDDEGLRLRFQREAEIVASLQHPNITTVHDLGVEDGVPYLVQEYLSGKDLSEVIQARKPVALERKLQILTGVASGLEQAHRRGIVHRDIKPGNIRLLDDGSVKVMDFGIAKLLADSETQLTQTGMMIGTAAYLAPEQVSDMELDHRCDIFSFGVVAYELLSYQRPFTGTTISALLYKINHDNHAPLKSVLPDAPPALASLVDDCLCKDPDGRPLSFTDVLRRLRGGEAVRRSTSEDATKALKAGSGVPARGAQGKADDFAAAAIIMTSKEDVNLRADPMAQTILETQVDVAAEEQSTADRTMTESSMSQMFQKASRPSVLAVGAMAAVAAGAIWFGLSRGDSPNGPSRMGGSVGSDDAGAVAAAGMTSKATSSDASLPLGALPLGTLPLGTSPIGTSPLAASDEEPQAAVSLPDPTVDKSPPGAASSNTSAKRVTQASPPDQNKPPSARPSSRSSLSELRKEAGQTGQTEQTGSMAMGEQVASATLRRPEADSVERLSKDASEASRRSSPNPARTAEPSASQLAPPRVSGPVGAGGSPPVVRAPSPINHEPALRRVLDAYAEAIRNMDAVALERVWPSLSRSQMSRFENSFSNARSMEIEISRCSFDIGTSVATADCRVTRGITPKAGRRQSNTSSRTFEFRLRGTDWELESV